MRCWEISGTSTRGRRPVMWGGVEKGLKESCCARYHFIVKVSLRVSSLELDIVGHFYVTVLRWIVDGLVSRLVR